MQHGRGAEFRSIGEIWSVCGSIEVFQDLNFGERMKSIFQEEDYWTKQICSMKTCVIQQLRDCTAIGGLCGELLSAVHDMSCKGVKKLTWPGTSNDVAITVNATTAS
jgi:hypothetical protein